MMEDSPEEEAEDKLPIPVAESWEAVAVTPTLAADSRGEAVAVAVGNSASEGKYFVEGRCPVVGKQGAAGMQAVVDTRVAVDKPAAAGKQGAFVVAAAS
jgi:hypothetical protein